MSKPKMVRTSLFESNSAALFTSARSRHGSRPSECWFAVAVGRDFKLPRVQQQKISKEEFNLKGKGCITRGKKVKGNSVPIKEKRFWSIFFRWFYQDVSIRYRLLYCVENSVTQNIKLEQSGRMINIFLHSKAFPTLCK